VSDSVRAGTTSLVEASAPLPRSGRLRTLLEPLGQRGVRLLWGSQVQRVLLSVLVHRCDRAAGCAS
jgi:hypothetical protein